MDQDNKTAFEIARELARPGLEPMRKTILKSLKNLTKEGRSRLAEIRRIKRESKPPKSPSQRMAEFIKARKSVDIDTELFMINKLLDRDDLTQNERCSLRNRKKSLLDRLTNRKS